MKLQFLGKSYRYQPHTIETENSEFTGHFLGSTYQIRRPITTKITTRSDRKYRGVAY